MSKEWLIYHEDADWTVQILNLIYNAIFIFSTSSRVKVLMDNSILPSPSRPPVLHSTPSVHHQKVSLDYYFILIPYFVQ